MCPWGGSAEQEKDPRSLFHHSQEDCQLKRKYSAYMSSPRLPPLSGIGTCCKLRYHVEQKKLLGRSVSPIVCRPEKKFSIPFILKLERTHSHYILKKLFRYSKLHVTLLGGPPGTSLGVPQTPLNDHLPRTRYQCCGNSSTPENFLGTCQGNLRNILWRPQQTRWEGPLNTPRQLLEHIAGTIKMRVVLKHAADTQKTCCVAHKT